MTIPPYLNIGDTIALNTPSSPIQSCRLELATQYFESNGFKVKTGQYVRESEQFLAGRDKDRAKDIINFFNDSSVKAIISTGGGYGSQRRYENHLVLRLSSA